MQRAKQTGDQACRQKDKRINKPNKEHFSSILKKNYKMYSRRKRFFLFKMIKNNYAPRVEFVTFAQLKIFPYT